MRTSRALPRSTRRMESPLKGQTASGCWYSPGPSPTLPTTVRVPSSMSTRQSAADLIGPSASRYWTPGLGCIYRTGGWGG